MTTTAIKGPAPFVRYDETGTIVSSGMMDEVHVDAEIAAGLRTLKGAGHWDTHRVDVATKTIVKKEG